MSMRCAPLATSPAWAARSAFALIAVKPSPQQRPGNALRLCGFAARETLAAQPRRGGAQAWRTTTSSRPRSPGWRPTWPPARSRPPRWSKRMARGSRRGVPLLVKDNIETDDGGATTAGSLALRDNVTGRDAPVVARLRAAGAVILGKTNLSEWANFRSAHSL